MKPKRLSRTTIYESNWVSLYRDQVQYPAGRISQEHHVLEFVRQGVAAIVENKQGQIVMIESYRYVTDSIELEVPAGSAEPGEDLAETAKREVLEETGYDSHSHTLLHSYYSTPGIANQIFNIFHCQAGEKLAEFDQNEVRSVKWYSRAELKEMIKKGQIKDGFTLAALLFFFA